MFKVLITDADAKHSLAIQRYLRSAIGDVYITGHTVKPARFIVSRKGAHANAVSPSLRS